MKIGVLVTPFSSSRSIAAEILDFAPGEVKLLSDDSVPVGFSVSVSFKNVKFDGEVMSCRSSENQFQLNVRIEDADDYGLRRSPRFTVTIPAQVFTHEAADPLPATIFDISGHGIGLELAVVLTVGETVAIESEINVAFGVVAYSRKDDEGSFRCGVALHHVLQKEKPAPAASNVLAGLVSRVRQFRNSRKIVVVSTRNDEVM